MKTPAHLDGLLWAALACAAISCRAPESSTQVLPVEDVITLRMSTCYRYCPAYRLELRSNGAVIYDGQVFVAEHGQRTSHVSPETFARLLEQFDAIHYDTLTWEQDCIDRHVSHNPWATTSLTRQGKFSHIHHYLGDGCAPPALGRLEEAIRNAVPELTAWLRCDGRCPP